MPLSVIVIGTMIVIMSMIMIGWCHEAEYDGDLLDHTVLRCTTPR